MNEFEMVFPSLSFFFSFLFFFSLFSSLSLSLHLLYLPVLGTVLQKIASRTLHPVLLALTLPGCSWSATSPVLFGRPVSQLAHCAGIEEQTREVTRAEMEPQVGRVQVSSRGVCFWCIATLSGCSGHGAEGGGGTPRLIPVLGRSCSKDLRLTWLVTCAAGLVCFVLKQNFV